MQFDAKDEYYAMLEDRVLILPPCVVSAFTRLLRDPAALITSNETDFAEVLFAVALKSAVRECGRGHALTFGITCLQDFWSIQINHDKYNPERLRQARLAWDAVACWRSPEPNVAKCGPELPYVMGPTMGFCRTTA
jgi:hypothetical protein